MNEHPYTRPRRARLVRFSAGVLAGLGLMLLAACGGGATTDSTGAQSASPEGQSGPEVIAIPTYAYVEPTVTIAVTARAEATPAATAEAAAAVALDPEKVERGRGRYEALGCAACHGEAGEGAADGPALLQFALSEDAFVTFMRSGGALGAEHQYSTDRLSASGGANLYQYLVSLTQASS